MMYVFLKRPVYTRHIKLGKWKSTFTSNRITVRLIYRALPKMTSKILG